MEDAFGKTCAKVGGPEYYEPNFRVPLLTPLRKSWEDNGNSISIAYTGTRKQECSKTL